MLIVDQISKLCAKKTLKLATIRRYRYELATWSRFDGPLILNHITDDTITKWRAFAADSGLRPRTVESVIRSVSTLAKTGGNHVAIGRPLRHVPTPPDVPTLEQFDAILLNCRSANFRLWLAALYVTGMRLADAMSLTGSKIRRGDIAFCAGKTSKNQPVPLPKCLARMATTDGRLCPATARWVRVWLSSACKAAGVPRFTPQQLRVLSAVEWERARPGCGAIILGHAMPGWSQATYYYLRAADQLRMALPAMRLPESLLSDTERAERDSGEQRLVETFRSLPPDHRVSLATVASAMAK